MSFFGGSKKSTSVSSVTNADERIAADGFANVIRAEEGATVNFGVSGADLTAALALRESPRFEAERRETANTIAGIGGGDGGGLDMQVVAILALAALGLWLMVR